jgi:3D (Asp-Asp-Asp) domain-containing protein
MAALAVLVSLGPVVLAEKQLRATMTFYYVADESSSRYDGEPVAVLRDVRGKVIARTTPRFKRDLVMQGSGWLRDGRTLIYMKDVGGESRFRVVKSKYGLGTKGCPLVPYRTIAVDSRVVKLGSTVYIPQLEGAKLPDGTTHDGLFIAADTGSFRGARVDVFTGAGPRSVRPFTATGYGSRSRITVVVKNTSGGCKPRGVGTSR